MKLLPKTLMTALMTAMAIIGFSQNVIARDLVTIPTHDGDVTVPLPQRYCDASDTAFGIVFKENMINVLSQLEVAPEITVFKKCRDFTQNVSTFGFILIENNTVQHHDQAKLNKWMHTLYNKTDTSQKLREKSAEIIKKDYSLTLSDPVQSNIVWTDDYSFIRQEINPSDQNFSIFFSSSTSFKTSDQRLKVATYFQYFKRQNQFKTSEIIREYSQLGRELKNIGK